VVFPLSIFRTCFVDQVIDQVRFTLVPGGSRVAETSGDHVLDRAPFVLDPFPAAKRRRLVSLNL